MNKTRILIIIILGLGLASCSPKYYIPNTMNVPLISEKGETNLTVAGGPNQVEFLGAYAITKNIAVVANGGLFIPSDLDNGDGGSGRFVEFGVGYFLPIRGNWVFETYGIAGIGSIENHLLSTRENHPQTTGRISANVLRLGIQPNFGYKSKYFSAAISSRFVNLSYNKIVGDLIFDGEQQTTYLKRNSSNFLIEPALTVRGGFEKFKLQIQYGYSLNLTNIDFRQDKMILSVGLSFNFK